jgi:soluble lytic murein transglycosylase-like protein
VAALKAAIGAVALALGYPGAPDPVERWSKEIGAASARFAIPESWIRRVIRAESGGETSLAGRPIVSRSGAMGLMQLMPGTWRDMRALLGLGQDPFKPSDNILAGTLYLRMMYDEFGYPGLFAAYNAGPARYRSYLQVARPLPAETRAYVAALAPASRLSTPGLVRWRRMLFAGANSKPAHMSQRPANGLFAVLRTLSATTTP